MSLYFFEFNDSTRVNRCQLWEKNIEIKDIKDQLSELVTLLWKSEAQRKELVREQKAREQAVVIALGTSPSVSPPSHHFKGLNTSCSDYKLGQLFGNPIL